jgi:hypothetical protein
MQNVDSENYTEYFLMRKVVFAEGIIELVREHVVINGQTVYGQGKVLICFYDRKLKPLSEPVESDLKKFHETIGKYVTEYGWRTL